MDRDLHRLNLRRSHCAGARIANRQVSKGLILMIPQVILPERVYFLRNRGVLLHAGSTREENAYFTSQQPGFLEEMKKDMLA